MIDFSRAHAHARARDIDVYQREGEIKESKRGCGGDENHQENHGGYRNLVPLQLQTPEFLEAWDEWVENRVALGKKYRWPISERSFVKAINKCEKWGVERSIAAIDHSIEYAYRGLFEPFHPPQQPEQPEVYKPGSSFRGKST